MSEIRPQAETEEFKRQRIVRRIGWALLIAGAAISGALAMYSSRYPRAGIVSELFLGLLAGYAAAVGISTGISLNVFNILPFVFAGPTKEEESPNLYAVNIILFALIGLALLAHVGWQFVHK